MVGTDISVPKSHLEVEGMPRGAANWSLLHSTSLCGTKDEDSLPTLEIRLHITIEVVCHLKMVQETRSLSVKELSLVEFVLDRILSLKEVLAQHGGVVPHTVAEILGHKWVTLSVDMTIPVQ
jgi:hypothetical protein